MSYEVQFHQQPRPKGQRTEIWAVWCVMKNGPVTDLGWVKWHAPWRRYVFVPLNSGAWGHSVFDAECLSTLATFCGSQTSQRKEARKREKV